MVTCLALAYGTSGNLLISGSEDGMVRVWNLRTRNIVRMFRHAKGIVKCYEIWPACGLFIYLFIYLQNRLSDCVATFTGACMLYSLEAFFL